MYTRPGLLVSARGARLNIYCVGSRSPAVVFDSGWEDWAPAWAVVQPRVARFARACSYDRAGAGFSDAGPMPRTTVRIADELHDALHNARIGGPYILVGHAFGADDVRAFAARYPSDIAGLVFVDGDAEDYEPADMQAMDHRGEASFIEQLRTCRDAVAGRKPLPPLHGRHGTDVSTCAQQFFRGLPEAAWSPALNAALLHIARTKVAMYDAYISEMEQMPWDEAYLKAHRRSLGSRPVVVISTGNHGVGSLTRPRPPSLAHLRYEYETNLAQWHLLGLSSNSKQVYADHSSEYVVFDEPDIVVTAIRDVYGASAARRRSNPTFRDCSACPEMVMVPAGTFTMGSSQAEKSWAASLGAIVPARKSLYLAGVADESPQHTVSLRAFALGRYDVTRDEFAAFVRETRYSAGDGCGYDSFKWSKQPNLTWQDPGLDQTGRDPVVCVSWRDAQRYVAWLNHKVGRALYRLPSESEWEYAARAGRQMRFWWGNDANAAFDYAWYRDNSGGHTHPVGAKPANAFGLYDIAGNVWQWTQDCYASSYAGAPTDGRANENKSNCLRVDRGGSWLYPAWLLRSATRERNPANYRDAIMGFRLARTLP